MYNSLLILNDNLSQSVKDVVHAIKKDDCLILEINYETTGFEDIQIQVNDIYTERQVLGEDMELETITFFFTGNVEYTDVFATYSEKDGKQILYDISNVDPLYASWQPIKNFVLFCKEELSTVANIDFIDLNHLFFHSSWSHIFNYLRNACEIDATDSHLRLNYISSDFSDIETRQDNLYGTENWLSDVLKFISLDNTSCKNILERIFTLNSDNKAMIEASTLFDMSAIRPVTSEFAKYTERIDVAKVMIVPLIQQKNDSRFATFIAQANTQYSTCFMFLNDEETSQSLMQKYTSVVGPYVGEAEEEYVGDEDMSYNIREIEMKMSVYLPMYWNDKDPSEKEITLSKNLNTISLDIDESTVFLEDNILENLVSLVKTSHGHISKIYFEIFNMNQNYNQSLDIIFTKLSSLPEYQDFVAFYYSSLIELSEYYHNVYFDYNTFLFSTYNMIYYENGEKCQYYNEPRHNIMDYLNVTDYTKFKVSEFVERNKIHNVVLYDMTFDGMNATIGKVQKTLTPNTILLPFNPVDDSYEHVVDVLRSMNSDPHVNLKNISIFQDFVEGSENYTLFDSTIEHQLKDVSQNDAELSSWSKFKDFVLTLQNDLGIENLDLLMCRIYSDDNWKYVLNNIESELTTLNIRSSDDNTGHVMFDGDWVLESEGVDVNMIRVYFTEEVKNLDIVLGGYFNEDGTLYQIPLIGEFSITTDSSGNYVYYPGAEEGDEFNVDISYALNVGIFKIKNVPSSSPLAVLNSGQTDKISYFGTTEETVDTTSSVIDLYVSSGNLSSPFYTFYTDSGGTNELSGNILYLNRSYRFNRLSSATSHAFYISDAGYGNASTTIQLSGDGSATSGITGSQSFTVNFNGLTNSATLTFYCTVHSSMVGTFTLADSDGYSSPNVDLTGYKFYSGDVYIKVDESFNDLSLYTTGYGGSYLGTEGKVYFDPDITYDGFTVDYTTATTEDLPKSLFLNIYKDVSGIVTILDSVDDFSGNIIKKYEIQNGGTFKIENIPQEYPITISENGTSNVEISGNASKTVSYDLNNVSYQFYYGDLEVIVPNYGFSSLTTYIYDTFDTSFIPLYEISFNPVDITLNSNTAISDKILPYNSYFQIYPKTDTDVYIHFTENDEMSGNFLDTYKIVNNGIYEIKNIPERYLLNISEVDSSFVEITGTDTSMTSYSFGSDSYDFYYGNMYLKVGNNDTDVSLNMIVYDTENEVSYNLDTKITITKNIVDVSDVPTQVNRITLTPIKGQVKYIMFDQTANTTIRTQSSVPPYSYGTPQWDKVELWVDGSQLLNTSTAVAKYASVYDITDQEKNPYEKHYANNYNAGKRDAINVIEDGYITAAQGTNADYMSTGGSNNSAYTNDRWQNLIITLNETISYQDIQRVVAHHIKKNYQLFEKIDIFKLLDENYDTIIEYSMGDTTGNFSSATSETGLDILQLHWLGPANDNTFTYTNGASSSNKNFLEYILDTNEESAAPSTTKLCLTLDIPESIEAVGPYTVLDLHPTISKKTYIQTVDFGMAKDQTYVIEAPEEYPLAFAGSENQTDISYIGYEENKQGEIVMGDVSFDLYSGPVFIQLNDDISASNEFTFYTVSGEDLNTTNKMFYDASCAATLDTDSSFVIASDTNLEYNMKFLRKKDSTTEVVDATTFTPGASGYSLIMTYRNTDTLNTEYYARGQYFMTSHTGSSGKKYSYYVNSAAILSESEAGTWNFGMRNNNDCFCSMYILEGNYAWSTNIKYNADTTTIDVESSPWNGTRKTDGVSIYTIADFMNNIDTNYPDANITKILEISRSSIGQANGSYTFEAGKLYSILIYWRHDTTSTGTSNNSIRFGYWKDGESAVSLPSSGFGGTKTNIGTLNGKTLFSFNSGDAVPSWWYRTFSVNESQQTNVIEGDSYELVPRFDIPVVPNTSEELFYSNQVFKVKKGFQYSLNQIPPWYPITILNDGLTSKITLAGDEDKTVSGYYEVEVSANNVYDISNTDASGITTYYKQTAYNFYYGDVKLNVFDTSFGDISGISMYSTYNGGTIVGPPNMIQSGDVKIPYDIERLNQISAVSVVENSNGDMTYALNGRNLILPNRQYGFHIGTYVFPDIPEEYAMTIMNNGLEDIIEISGSKLKGNYSAPDGNTYPFYYDSITMQVKSLTGIDDVSFSICSYNNGYMGGEGLLIGMNEHFYNIMEQDLSFNDYPLFNTSSVGEDEIDFKYQPFDYTVTGNENYYVRGATLVRGNLSLHNNSKLVDYTTTADRYAYRLDFVLNDSTSGIIKPTTNNAHILSFNSNNTLTIDTGNANSSNDTLASIYDHYVKIGPTGGTNQFWFLDADGNPSVPDNTIFQGYFGSNSTSIFSHHFALCTDSTLTEDSILYPIHVIQNGNNFSTKSYLFYTFYYTSAKLGSNKARHGDWNDALIAQNAQLATGTNVYLYALSLGTDIANDPAPTGGISMLSNIEYTDSSGVDVSFANPVQYTDQPNVPVAVGDFKYIYIVGSGDDSMTVREVECYVNGVNVALSSNGASADWTKTDINTTTTSAHNIGASTKANDGTITLDGTDSNLAHGNVGNGWVNMLITLPQTYAVNDLQRITVHPRELSTWPGHYSGKWKLQCDYIRLLADDKSTIVVEYDQTWATYNNDNTNPVGTFAGKTEVNYLGPADDPNTTDFTIYDGDSSIDISMSTVTYEDNALYTTKYTYYSECLINDASMTIIETDSSGASAPIFNNDISFEEHKVYSVYDGSYNINVGTDASNAIALLNHDVSNAITYTGTNLVDTKTSVYDSENTYKYYNGTITVTVESSFIDVLLFEHLDASSGDTKFSKLMYSKTCDPSILFAPVVDVVQDVSDDDTPVAQEIPDVVICLNAITTANVIQDDASNNVYIFNSYSTYDTKRKFGIHEGTYIINNIPTDHPMTLLNADVSDIVFFSGDDLYGTKMVNDVSYNFYTGTVKLSITKDFTSRQTYLSAYCYHHGYMGAENYFVYSDTCDGRAGDLDFMHVVNKQCLRTKSGMKVSFDSSGRQKIILNYDIDTNNTYDSSLYYGLDIGSYVIENIPNKFPLAIYNHDVSNVIQYTGETVMDYRLNFDDGHYYNYYSGFVKMDVMAIPTDTSFISFGTSQSRDMLERNKLLFDDECSTDDYYYDCLEEFTVFDVSGSTMKFNNTVYSGTKKMGIYKGYYMLKDVPKENPIAFVSSTKQDVIKYTGLDFNKSVLTVDGESVDFYSGNVALTCLGDFDNDLKLYMKNGDGFESMNIYYTDYCIYDAGTDDLTPTIQCLDRISPFSTAIENTKINILLGEDETLDHSKLYGFNIGLYKFQNVPIERALRITNDNIINNDIYLTTSDPDNIVNYTRTDLSYDYYFGDVYMHVTTDISYLDSGINFECASVLATNQVDKFIYSSECLTDDSYYLQCIDTSASVSIDSGNYVLNANTSYKSNMKYGVYIGNYTLVDISTSYPIAILNNDVSGIVSYTGDVLESTQDVSGISYNFYSGNIYITIRGDYSEVLADGLSFYTSNNGFMGGENSILFSSICDSMTPGYFTEALPQTTAFELDNQDNLLMGFDLFNEYRRPSLFVGTYTITNVPATHPIAILNKNLETKIAYTGTDVSGNYEVDDKFYNFYYGTVSIYVMEPLEGLDDFEISEFISIYSYPHGYLGMENKICYDHFNGSYTDLSYTICLATNSSINMYSSEDLSVNYTFNSASDFYDYKRMGMHVGNYRLVNVPMSDPIALLNSDVSHVITYSGANNKKIQAQGPDGNTYDFYFGDVDIEVIGDFGTLSAYSANGNYAGAQDVFVFDDLCETVGYITECVTLDTSMNIDDDGHFTFNNGIYNEYKKFGLYEGSYSIKNIPSTQAIALLNHDISDNVVVSGDAIDLCGNFSAPDGYSYNFYTNEINITVKNPFEGFLPIYSYTDQSYNNGAELLVYSDLCTSINKHKMFTYCLKNNGINDVSFAQNDSTKMLLDSTLVNHNQRRNYGVYLGNYIFEVPEGNPIAFLNFNKTDKVSYFGDKAKRTRKAGPLGDTVYDYYYGKVVLNVLGDFDELQFHFLNGGFLGGEDAVIKFTDFCNDGETNTAIECLMTQSPLYLMDLSGDLVYVMNAGGSINNNRKFGMHDGIYEITDICNNYPIAIMNNGLTEYIDYIGADEDLCGNFVASDGNTYKFYKNKITVVVSGDFSQSNNVSIFSNGGDISGNFGMQEKLVYSELCEDTTTREQENISDDVGSLDFYLLQLSTY
jgi:hypothetical protein